MENTPEGIVFTSDTGEDVVFYILEQTRLAGVDYLLVSTDVEDDEDAEALILKDISDATSEEAIYDIVEDEQELEMVASIFKELLDEEVGLE